VIERLKRLPVELFISLDQLVNVLLLGSADETLSARAWRTEQKGRIFGRLFRPLIDLLFFWQPTGGLGHCQQAFQRERAKFYLPPEYRE
jgi:hypothetical protein